MKNYLILLLVVAFSTTAFAKHHKHYKTKHYHKHTLGLKRDASKHKAYKSSKNKKSVSDVVVPASVDLSAKVSPPEDQGQCGSCWDFSITKALRSALMLAGKDPGVLAFNYLLNNCGGPVSESGCNGGDFPAGDNMISGLGPWLESQDPYTQSEGQCKQGLAVAASGASWNVVGDGSSAPSFQSLAQAVAANHMLSVDVAVCGDWESYSSGIFDENQCGSGSINHMINMVGYNCETSVDAKGNCKFDSKGQPVNGDGYLLVMNNWGSSWGENGYMRTRYGVDAIADTAMYFEVK